LVIKVSPPFEGGVAGTIDYLIFTKFVSRPGWLIYSFLLIFMFMYNKNLFNRKDLKSFRSSLRKRSTSAEAELWELLKSKKLEGRKFRRQYSIGNYIVDFCCPKEKLIIELDGDPHGEYHKIQKDEIRDNYLANLGFTVVRFENRFVFQEPEYIKSEITKVFNKKHEAN
jgi:very-short-patch-repair endonuclease